MFSILSPSEPILRAKIENMISPDYVWCYIPQWKFWENLKILGNFGKIWIVISKVGGKLWRRERYLTLWAWSSFHEDEFQNEIYKHCKTVLFCLSKFRYIFIFLQGMYSQGNLESKFAVFDAGSWRCKTEASGEGGSQHFFQSTCLQFSLCKKAHYMQLFLYKRTHRNECEGLLDIVRHRLDIPHVGSWQNHCCQPSPMCSQHLATVFQLLNGRIAFVQKCWDFSRRSPCHELHQQEARDHAKKSHQSLPG